MGIRNFLIDGVSGSGKTAVATELQRRGFQAIHGDRELAYHGDPQTGLPMVAETVRPSALWLSDHHIWDVDKVRTLVAARQTAMTFFCGGSRNSSAFIDLFDSVFVLEIDRQTMNQRIAQRVALDPTDFGGTPEELDLIGRLYATRSDAPKGAISIDAAAPLARVVDDILSFVGQ